MSVSAKWRELLGVAWSFFFVIDFLWAALVSSVCNGAFSECPYHSSEIVSFNQFLIYFAPVIFLIGAVVGLRHKGQNTSLLETIFLLLPAALFAYGVLLIAIG